MGCDIIMHSQVKKDNEWVWYDYCIFDERSYTLYGILDGTRGTEFKPIISEYRGFPEDSKDKLKKSDPYDNDYTTEEGVYLGYTGVNYLSLRELQSFDWDQEIPNRPKEWGTMRDCTFCREVLPYLEELARIFGGPDNVRIVFGYTV